MGILSFHNQVSSELDPRPKSIHNGDIHCGVLRNKLSFFLKIVKDSCEKCVYNGESEVGIFRKKKY